MRGSDRLEDEQAPEASEAPVEGAEASETQPTAETPPARRPRARRTRASETPATEAAQAEEPAAAEPSEAPAPAPARRTRARQPRAAATADAPAAEGTETAEAPPAPRARTSRRRATPAAEATAEPAADTAPAPEPEAAPAAKRIPRLLERYRASVRDTLLEEFGYGNVMQIPKIDKVVLNIGLGETKTNPRAMESATRDLSIIAGQKPMVTRAKRSIAGFKLREGDPIGVAVTLRGSRMYEFMDRLVNAALPRIRDFRGVSRRAFDGRGNYSLGIREQVIFPEIDYGQIDRIRSLQVSIVTTASTDREAMRLLDLLGVPFTREQAGPGGDGSA